MKVGNWRLGYNGMDGYEDFSAVDGFYGRDIQMNDELNGIQRKHERSLMELLVYSCITKISLPAFTRFKISSRLPILYSRSSIRKSTHI